MENAFAHLLAPGEAPCLIIGSDSPSLPSEVLQGGLELLAGEATPAETQPVTETMPAEFYLGDNCDYVAPVPTV